MSQVFVYGSLKKGFKHHDFLNGARYVARGTILANMFRLPGNYPIVRALALDLGGITHGEIYEVDATALTELDTLEMYFPERKNASVYVREAMYTRSGRSVFVYVAGPRINLNICPRILSGIWTLQDERGNV